MVFGKYHSLFFSSLAIYLAGFSWTRWEVFLSLWQIWHWTHCWRCCYGKLCFFVSKFVKSVFFWQSKQICCVPGELLFTGCWPCWTRSTWSTWEGTPPSSTGCWSFLKIRAQSGDNPHLQGSRKTSTSGTRFSFSGSYPFAISWICDWGEFFLLRILNKLFLIVISCSQNSCWPIKVSLTNCEVI